MSELGVLLARQHRVVSRAQALAHGLTPHALAHRLGRTWSIVLPGVYAAQTGELTARQRCWAALLHAGPGSMLGAHSAARAHRLRTVPEDSRVHLLVEHARRPVPAGFVVVRRARCLPTPWLMDHLPVAPPARAVVDCCRTMRSLRPVRALVAEAVQRGYATVGQLAAEVDGGGSAGSALVRRAIEEVAAGTRSAPEAELRALLRRAGLPEPVWNADLYTTGGLWIARPDAWWPDAGVAFEVDSREWHLSPEDWERDLRRHARMSAHGIVVLHCTPRRLRTEPAQVLAELRGALAQGLARPPLDVIQGSSVRL